MWLIMLLTQQSTNFLFLRVVDNNPTHWTCSKMFDDVFNFNLIFET